MKEIEKYQNWRLAFGEASLWLRYIDNMFWIISSFWMIGTSYAFIKALQWNGDKWQVLIMGLTMIVIWLIFLLFKKNIFHQSNHYYDRVNYYEDRLKVDVLPKQANDIKGGIRFGVIMTIVAYSTILTWCGFIIQFIIKNWCNFCH